MSTLLPQLAGIFGVCGFIIFIIYRFRSDGANVEKLKNEVAINDQNDELLEYLKKEKDFLDTFRNLSAADRKRMLDAVNDSKK